MVEGVWVIETPVFLTDKFLRKIPPVPLVEVIVRVDPEKDKFVSAEAWFAVPSDVRILWLP